MHDFYTKNKITKIILGESEEGKRKMINTNIISLMDGGPIAGGESAVASKRLAMISGEDRVSLMKGLSYIEFDVEAMDCSKPTFNNVLYKKAVLDEAMKHELFIRRMHNGGLASETNHPIDRNDLVRYEFVDMNNVTHYVTKFWWEGDKLMARVRTKAMPNNKLVVDILQGRLPALSIRGIIAGHYEGDMLVVDRYLFVAFDYVSVQSNPGSSNITNMSLVSLLNSEANHFDFQAVPDSDLPKAAGESGLINTNGKFVRVTLCGAESGMSVICEYEELPRKFSATDIINSLTAF